MTEITSETLYRKYRPDSFTDILGQDEVVEALTNSIKNKSISHSYLFSGGRGTGKTSIARIFATELGTAPEDIYEIDAASNRGIGEIRELKEGVDTRPFSSNYKVYIIDEVHMLTKEAFNALLKTLEEPPSHVLFILATTEKHKILDTIISRCQAFDFNRPTRDQLVGLVGDICKKEKRKIDQESAEYIASLGDGSFRDTLSHLQKAFSYFEKDIDFETLTSHLSISSAELAFDFVQALNDRDTDKLFSAYHSHKDRGEAIEPFVSSVLENIRVVLLLRYSTAYSEHMALNQSADKLEKFRELSGINSNHLKDIIQLVQNMSQTNTPEAMFEVFLFEQTQGEEDKTE